MKQIFLMISSTIIIMTFGSSVGFQPGTDFLKAAPAQRVSPYPPPLDAKDIPAMTHTPRRPPRAHPTIRLPLRRKMRAPSPSPGQGDAGIWFTTTEATGYYAAHEVYPDLQLPPVPPGAPWLFLYAPTGKNPGNCEEIVTAYFRFPGDTTTTREYWIVDKCNNPDTILAFYPIDAAFLADYVRPFGGRNMYISEVIRSEFGAGIYYALLWNFTMSWWDLVWQLNSTFVHPNGWSSHENYFQDAQLCPSLPPIMADDINLDFPQQGWVRASPNNSEENIQGWCHPSPYNLQMINRNWTWQVTTP